MTREKYESLPLSTLKALAKSRNMKGISTLRKEALIERMLEEDQKENQKNMEEPAVLKEEKKTEIVTVAGYRCMFCGATYETLPDVCGVCHAIGSFENTVIQKKVEV